MRRGLTLLLITALLFGGTYWYNVARAVCDVPVMYRLGTIDPKFKVSKEEVKAAASEAESLWENATGKNLFTYDENGNVAINFVYDERQQQTDEAQTLRSVIARKENMSDSVRSQYEVLLTKYDALKAQYETRSTAYDTKLAAYNKEVADWNTKGGAPRDVYERLAQSQTTLKTEQLALNTVAGSLNVLAKQMNALGAQGNSLISDYNNTVSEFNNKFSEGHEFTQGDYGHSMINIYEYTTHSELVLVLAHELGHALSLNHVDETTAVMYHLMGKQSLTTGVTQSDLTEFSRVCGDGTVQGRMARVIRENLFKPKTITNGA